MNGILWVAAVITGGVALFALGYTVRLGREVRELKRSRYHIDQKIHGMTKQVSEDLAPLRVQLAAVAAGIPVPEELIHQGRLYHDISAEEAHQEIVQRQEGRSSRMLIVDVRTAKEYAAQHLPQAKLIPMEELETRHESEIPRTMEKVFVYCAGGDRSRLACDYLSRLGYMNLYHIKDGIKGWNGPITGETPVDFIHIQSKSHVR